MRVGFTIQGAMIAAAVGALCGAAPATDPPRATTAPAGVRRPAAGEAPPAASATATAPAEPLPPGAIARFGSAWMHHGTWIRALAFSPNGRLLASCGGRHSVPGTIRLWDIATGRVVRSLPGHKYSTVCIAFSPDGRTLVSAGQDRTVRFWDVASGKAAAGFSAGSSRGNWVAFAPDGKTVAVCTGTTVELVGAKGGRTVRIRDSRARACAFSPDGKWLAAASYISTKPGVSLYDPSSGKLIRKMGSDGQRFTVPAFSPDGRRLAAGCYYGANAGSITVWEPKTGKVVRRMAGRGGYYVNLVTFSPDGRLLAAASRGGGVSVWEVEKGTLVRQLAVSGSQAYAAAFSPDGKVLAAGGPSGQIRLWRVGSFEPRSGGIGHREAIRSVAVFPDARRVLTGGSDGTAWLWDARGGRPIRRLVQGPAVISSVAVSPDGSVAAACEGGETVHLWDTATGALRKSVELTDGAALALAFVPGRKELVAVGASGAISTIDQGRWTVTLRRKADKLPLTQAAVSGDGRLVALTDRRVVSVYDVRTGKSCGTFHLEGQAYHYGLALDRFGRLLVLDASRKLVLIELDSGKPIWEAALSAPRTGSSALAFSPDASVLAVGEQDGSVALWNVLTGKRLSVRKGHRNAVGALAFSPDGRLLLSGSADTTAILWPIGELVALPAAGSARHDPDKLNELWEALAATDPAKAQEAMWALVAGGERSAAFLAERLRLDRRPRRQEIRKLVQDMGHQEFSVRAQAFEKLARLGVLAETDLRLAVERTDSEEIRARARQLLGAIDDPHRRLPAVVRYLRAVHVLERIGSAPAAEVLRGLAKGSSHASLTRRAAAALERMAHASKAAPR